MIIKRSKTHFTNTFSPLIPIKRSLHKLNWLSPYPFVSLHLLKGCLHRFHHQLVSCTYCR